jgi:hypothetical protein
MIQRQFTPLEGRLVMKETVKSAEATSVNIYQTTQYNIPEASHLVCPVLGCKDYGHCNCCFCQYIHVS